MTLYQLVFYVASAASYALIAGGVLAAAGWIGLIVCRGSRLRVVASAFLIAGIGLLAAVGLVLI